LCEQETLENIVFEKEQTKSFSGFLSTHITMNSVFLHHHFLCEQAHATILRSNMSETFIFTAQEAGDFFITEV
jgi:hypothetical protein